MGGRVCKIRLGPAGAYLGRRRATPPRSPGSSWHLFSGSVGRSVGRSSSPPPPPPPPPPSSSSRARGSFEPNLVAGQPQRGDELPHASCHGIWTRGCKNRVGAPRSRSDRQSPQNAASRIFCAPEPRRRCPTQHARFSCTTWRKTARCRRITSSQRYPWSKRCRFG